MTRSDDAVLAPATASLSGTAPPPVLSELVASAGIQFNGDNPWDIRVRDREVYHRLMRRGLLGLGEAYMDGLWECERLDELFTRLRSHRIGDRLHGRSWLRLLPGLIRNRLFTPSNHRRLRHRAACQEIGDDYEVFEAMLDPSMSYSCAYWSNAITLEQAQRHKLDLICKKLELKSGEWLLDIGCGWGNLARHAAEHYGVVVTGITLSREQLRVARERCAGLPVNLELMDYRDLSGRFDKIASIGMFEHVGPKHYPHYFDMVQRLLADDGLFLLHTRGDCAPVPQSDPWLQKYIFPDSLIPSARQIVEALERSFFIEDWHCFGHDYDHTLMAWWDNFDAAWPRLQVKYDERFYRMWKYYLLSAAGLFRSRQGQVWQLVLGKCQRTHPYRSVR